MNNESFEYMECLYEMATIRPASSLDKLGILLAVNPDSNRDGNPYFKMYNSTSFYTATTVWRISFTESVFIKEHKGKIKASTSMNKSEKTKLIEYLSLESKDFRGSTIWDELKYRWNSEKDLMNNFSFSDYISGKADNYYKTVDNKGNYVPFSLKMPDYNNL